MLFEGKKIYYSKHARLRSFQWSFDIKQTEIAFKKGFHISSEKNTGIKLCIYKEKEQYFTIVYKADNMTILIVTLYHSNPKQIKMAEGKWL